MICKRWIKSYTQPSRSKTSPWELNIPHIHGPSARCVGYESEIKRPGALGSCWLNAMLHQRRPRRVYQQRITSMLGIIRTTFSRSLRVLQRLTERDAVVGSTILDGRRCPG